VTAFVGVRNMAKWLATQGIDQTIAGLMRYIEDDFRRWESFDRVPRIASHTPFGVIELMPTSDHEAYGFKYVNGHPNNPQNGFQTVTAFGVLADVYNGYPTFLSEMTMLTALRTAATSAMCARYLARPDSQVMAIIGAGSQSEFQAIAMRIALGITSLRVWDPDPAARAKLAGNLRPLGFDVYLAVSVADAGRGADIVTTCTADKSHSVVFPAELVTAGMHINAIGGDCPGKTELDATTLERAAVFVEFIPQTRIEGEIQQLAADFAVTEMWEVISGAKTGRSGPDQVTVFDSVGFAIEDFAALRYVRDSVVGTDFWEDIDLVADPEDPKDLFGYIGAFSPVLT
jgi:ornithine cyclodeaminase